MAGHSKWANIQHRKGRQGEERGKIWTRVIREITVAARSGLPDPTHDAEKRIKPPSFFAPRMPPFTRSRVAHTRSPSMPSEVMRARSTSPPTIDFTG